MTAQAAVEHSSVQSRGLQPEAAASAALRPPTVALIHLVSTPYWQHLHRRLARELPEIEFHSLYTHEVPDQPWSLDPARDVRPLCFGAGAGVDQRGVRRQAAEWAKAGRIIRWLRERRCAAVVLYGYNDVGRLRVARWCAAGGVPWFVAGDSNIHGDRASGLRRALKNLLVPRIVRSAHGVLPFGSAGRQFFERYGARPERVFPCPGEPDYGAFEQAGPDRVAEAARRLRLAPGRRRIVYVGRLIGLKRVDLLAGAFARIAAERPEWDLLLVGDGPLRGELEARLGGPLAGRVRWAGFVNDPVELAAILKNGDLLVLPSDTDAWALVVNEAMAAGLAVITSDVVGAAEDLVRSGENGATFRRGDAESLTAALLEVTNPAAIDRLRAGSVRLLARWREVADPVAGFRAALRSAGVPGLESGGTGQGP